MPDSEVARIFTRFGKNTRIFILTDTGRIMSRYSGDTETRFSPVATGVPVGSARANRLALLATARRMGYREIRP